MMGIGSPCTPEDPRSKAWVSSIVVIASSLALIIVTSACGLSGVSWAQGVVPDTSVSGYSGEVTSFATSERNSNLPTEEQLKAALLNAKDTGLKKYMSTGSDDNSTVTGCPILSDTSSSSSDPSVEQEAEFKAGDSGPFLQEFLATDEAATLATGYSLFKSELAKCHTLTFDEGGTQFTLTLSPIKFGGEGSIGVRMDGDINGIQVTGYMSYELFGPVLLGFFYIELGDGSSQAASAFYRQAVDKLHRTIPQTGGSSASSQTSAMWRSFGAVQTAVTS